MLGGKNTWEGDLHAIIYSASLQNYVAKHMRPQLGALGESCALTFIKGWAKHSSTSFPLGFSKTESRCIVDFAKHN